MNELAQEVQVLQAQLMSLYVNSIAKGEFDLKSYKQAELSTDRILAQVLKTQRLRRGQEQGSEILRRSTRPDND